jgi:hypothetical protein
VDGHRQPRAQLNIFGNILATSISKLMVTGLTDGPLPCQPCFPGSSVSYGDGQNGVVATSRTETLGSRYGRKHPGLAELDNKTTGSSCSTSRYPISLTHLIQHKVP